MGTYAGDLKGALKEKGSPHLMEEEGNASKKIQALPERVQMARRTGGEGNRPPGP